jgi:hypothetical protein
MICYLQVSESQQGLLSWATQSMNSTEMVLEGFVASALEHDALMRRADMQGLQEGALQAGRIIAHYKSEAPSKHAQKQLQHVQRLEQTIAHLRQDLEKSKTGIATKMEALQEAQQNINELLQVRDLKQLHGRYTSR